MYGEDHGPEDEMIGRHVRVLGNLRKILRSIRKDVRCQTYVKDVTEAIIQSHVNGFLYGQVGTDLIKYSALKDLQVNVSVDKKGPGPMGYKITCKSAIVKSFVSLNRFVMYTLIRSDGAPTTTSKAETEEVED